MILIYTSKITPRVRYIFKHIFTRILGIDIDFTSKVEDFVAHSGIKISYAKFPLGGEFFIKSHELLFEQGIHEIEIDVDQWETTSCFFKSGEKSIIPFDIFAASFYLVTRYEEYLPHFKDSMGNYKASQSLAFVNNFLDKPVVDIWAYKLLEKLKERFPDYNYRNRAYKYISTIAINHAYSYKNRSLLQGTLGALQDIYRLTLYKVIDRFKIILIPKKKDPYDNYDEIIKLQNRYNIKTLFFFLISKSNRIHSGISHHNTNFQLLIKNIVDYSSVGIQPSLETLKNTDLLKHEKETLESITHMSMTNSQQHKISFELPITYQNLIDQEIESDYSMGYNTHTGFRASTCTPFYFYDIHFEIQTPLKIHSLALTDVALRDHMKLTPKQSLGKIKELRDAVKAVNGTLITAFRNESISGYGEKWSGWENVYENTLKIVRVK